MRLFNSTVLFVAWRYIKGSKKQRFASFVGMFATLGIAIGVCALIVVSSIMQGLQNRLKENILSDSAHVVVESNSPDDIDELLALDKVNAIAPFVQGEVMLQYNDQIIMAVLQGMDYNSLFLSPRYALVLGYTSEQREFFRNADSLNNAINATDREIDDLLAGDPRLSLNVDSYHDPAKKDNLSDQKIHFRVRIPQVDSAGYSYGDLHLFRPGSFSLAMNGRNMSQLGMDFVEKRHEVLLTSTRNARYTPLGLAPVQRKFDVVEVIDKLDNSNVPTIIGNYEDVRKFFRIPPDQMYYRLFLQDPFDIECIKPFLDGKYRYWDWGERYGDFFKAVALEKITMSVMLCLIIVVAAFNILSSLTMVVSSRISEIAILKTLGMTNHSVLMVFLWVGMSASILGSCLGVVLGIPLALHAQTILHALGISIVRGELPIEINMWNVVLIVGLCFVVSILCTLYPAYHASNTDPVRNLAGSGNK